MERKVIETINTRAAVYDKVVRAFVESCGEDIERVSGFTATPHSITVHTLTGDVVYVRTP